jgi:predicted anti-sigma-YlaC factor YlaD
MSFRPPGINVKHEGAHMTCADHQKIINCLIDHEIKATDCAELFEHLGTCAECRRFYDTILTLGTELDKIPPFMDEMTEAPVQPGLAASRRPEYRVADQRRIAPRPSSLVFAIVVMLVVTLLFSIDVKIEKPTQVIPSASTSQR